MHTLKTETGWVANVNGDFSGDVRLSHEEKGVDVTLPFDVLKSLVAEYVRREKITRLEEASLDQMCGIE